MAIPYTPTSNASLVSNPAQGATPATSQTNGGAIPFAPGQTAPAPAPALAPPAPDLLSRISDFLVKNNFPGAQVGNAVGNSVGAIISAVPHILKGDFTTAKAVLSGAAAQNGQNFGKIVGDTAQSVALPISMALGGGAGSSIAARVGNAALKYGATSAAASASGALAKGGSATDALKAGAVGGATGALGGGALQGLSEGLSAVFSNLPNRLVKNALPKLNADNAPYVLANTKLGSISTLKADSQSAVSNLGEQVQTILKHPEFSNDVGAGDFAIQKTLNAFPNSDYTAEHIVDTVKGLMPGQSQLVDKVANGTATLAEKNTLRASLDPIIKKVFTDAPQVSASKQIGAEFANALRGEVQSFAPETAPIFAHMSQEIDLRNALNAADKKLAGKSAISLYDIVAGLGGLTTSGPLGAAGAIAAEKALRSPAVGLAAAKGLKAAIPAVSSTLNAARGPLVTGAASAAGQGTTQ